MEGTDANDTADYFKLVPRHDDNDDDGGNNDDIHRDSPRTVVEETSLASAPIHTNASKNNNSTSNTAANSTCLFSIGKRVKTTTGRRIYTAASGRQPQQQQQQPQQHVRRFSDAATDDNPSSHPKCLPPQAAATTPKRTVTFATILETTRSIPTRQELTVHEKQATFWSLHDFRDFQKDAQQTDTNHHVSKKRHRAQTRRNVRTAVLAAVRIQRDMDRILEKHQGECRGCSGCHHWRHQGSFLPSSGSG